MTLPYGYPQQWPPPAPPSRAGLAWLQALLAVLGLVGVIYAVGMVLVPLPHGAGGGYCGPGASSRSAVSVFRNPEQVRDGLDGQPVYTSEEDTFVAVCKSAAQDRLVTACILAAGAVALGGLGPVVAGAAWNRRES